MPPVISKVVATGYRQAGSIGQDVRRHWQDLAIVAVLVLLSLILFRSHVFGDGLYIGNPDRLNSNLKILKFQVDGMTQGRVDAWNQFEMLGYDTFVLPYTFPSLLTLIAYLIGPENIYVGAGYVLPVLLSMAGIAAYGFLRITVGSAFAAFIGALLYQFSALTLLKVSQNDLSFAVFIFIPLLMIAIRLTRSGNYGRSFFFLATLMFLMFHFTFLQKASYAMILAGCYCLYQTITKRDWKIAAMFAAACVVATIGAFPRLYGIALAMHEYSRTVAGLAFDQFADIYRFQAIFPEQLWRWLDDGIFGRYPAEGVRTLRNYTNLTEGFLLYTSSFVPFLIVSGLLFYRNRPLVLVHSSRKDGNFFFWFLVFTLAVIAVPFVLKLVWLLYFRTDFTHARILIVGLLPLAVVVGLILADLEPKNHRSRPAIKLWLMAGLLSILLIGGIELIARSLTGDRLPPPVISGLRMRHEAMARIGLSFAAVACLLVAIRGWRLDWSGESRIRHVKHHPILARTAYCVLGLSIGLHTFLGAEFRINDSYTHTGLPFEAGNYHYSTKANFHPPKSEAIEDLKQRLDNDNYRSVLLCDANIAGGFCAGHIPEFWQLRVVDGYYGLGVPTRLALLPWRFGRGLRTVSHTNLDQVDWRVLSLLNVKYVVMVDQALYRNNSAGPNEPVRPASPADVKATLNPLPVTPRYFFARNVIPVTNAQQAAARLFEGSDVPNVSQTSFVEGLSSPTRYSDLGAITASGSGDRVRISLEAAVADRFLIANELYFPGWTATADGKPIPIYPTNAVMRGIVVPAGATTIEFTYTPFTRRKAAFAFYGMALLLLAAGTWTFGRLSSRA